ncbi:ribonuclease T2 family protein [Rheinheimera hassiensis]|uniref:ribonuclease T2 family protein n=1 Tax=Rheinheimera hassiensis TaxID=1193627 RepID=UPI001F0653E1|nr:MBL fold metallo-hydrolase [Rheinheimera hassiensis]
MKRRASYIFTVYFCLSFLSFRTVADAEVKVLDIGAGLATVITLPDNQYVIFDAGRSGTFLNQTTPTINSFQRALPPNAQIAILFISHTDGDHIGAVPWLLENFDIREVVHTGYDRSYHPTQAWDNMQLALSHTEATVSSLAEKPSLQHGHQWKLGNVTFTLLSGFSTPPESWHIHSNSSEHRNAGSLVVRMDYSGNSVLFTGDAVGKKASSRTNEHDSPIADEKYLLDHHSGHRSIRADVLIAAHHGADNSNSSAFIKAVLPRSVIFSAGNSYDHPRAVTVKRFINAGITPSAMLRTDRCGVAGPLEWDGWMAESPDSVGDDDISIKLTKDGQLFVDYVYDDNNCDVQVAIMPERWWSWSHENLSKLSKLMPFEKTLVEGNWDYWLIDMSWMPAFCGGKNYTPTECRPQASKWSTSDLAIHGLWPNRNDGKHLVNCTTNPYCGGATACSLKLEDLNIDTHQALIDRMPGHVFLTDYEWKKHGTCSDLTPNDYYVATVVASDQLRNPSFLSNAVGDTRSSKEIRAAFSISQVDDGSVVLRCKNSELTSVRACFEKTPSGDLGKRVKCPKAALDQDNCSVNSKIVKGRYIH